MRTTPEQGPDAARGTLVRFTVDQVHGMIAAGVLEDGAPVELLAGLLRLKDRSATGEPARTIGKRHNYVVKVLVRLDVMLRAANCHVQTQGPLTLSPYDESEPDGLILKGSPVIANVRDRTLEVHRRPDQDSGSYTERTVLAPGEPLSLPVVGEVATHDWVPWT